MESRSLGHVKNPSHNAIKFHCMCDTVVYIVLILFVAVTLGADELISLLHDVAEWKLLAIALDVDMEAGRTSGSASCEHFISEMIQRWIQMRGKDIMIGVIV